MPELPEVQTVADVLTRLGIRNRTITGINILRNSVIGDQDEEKFCAALTGSRIEELQRHGKYIIFKLDRPFSLVVHLRMTGKFRFTEAETSPLPHDRLILDLDDGRRLAFNDTRTFGRFHIVSDTGEFLKRTGIDALDPALTPEIFRQSARKRNVAVKTFLMDQRTVAGLGNIYTDEILFHCGIRPAKKARTVSLKQWECLLENMRRILTAAIANGGSSLGDGSGNYRSPDGSEGRQQDHHRVYGRTGNPCFKCGAAIIRSVIGGRSCHYCPVCQR